MGILVWFLVVSRGEGVWRNAFFYPIVVGLNFFVMFWIGVLIIKAIVFPYSFWGSRNAIIGSNCIRYGEEFSTLVEKSYVLMRVHLMKLIEEDYLNQNT